MFEIIIKHRWLSLYIFCAALLISSWYLTDSKSIRIISLLAFVIAQFLYNVTDIRKEDFYIKFLNWVVFALVAILWVSYLQFSTGEVDTGIVTLIISPLVFLIGLTLLNAYTMNKSKGVVSLVLSYLVMSSLIVVIFGYVLSMVSIVGSGPVNWVVQNRTLNDTWDYIYFSSQIFYSNTLGDIIPTGYSKMIVIMESILSIIIHVVLLGLAVNRLTNNGAKVEKK